MSVTRSFYTSGDIELVSIPCLLPSSPTVNRERPELFPILTASPMNTDTDVEWMGHMVALFLIFGGTSMLPPVPAVRACVPTSTVPGFPFLHVPAGAGDHFLFFAVSHPNRCEGMARCAFD